MGHPWKIMPLPYFCSPLCWKTTLQPFGSPFSRKKWPYATFCSLLLEKWNTTALFALLRWKSSSIQQCGFTSVGEVQPYSTCSCSVLKKFNTTGSETRCRSSFFSSLGVLSAPWPKSLQEVALQRSVILAPWSKKRSGSGRGAPRKIWLNLSEARWNYLHESQWNLNEPGRISVNIIASRWD